MEYSPLTLNPALAGANYNLQANVNYRTQWNSVGAPFQTIAASTDMRLNDNNRNKSGYLAAGLSAFHDQAGEERITTSNLNLSIAYHLKLNQNSTIGLGIYGGFGQRVLNPNGGLWGNQYNGMNYDHTIVSGEQFNNMSFSIFDAGAGCVYSFRKSESRMRSNNGTKVNLGIAVYHINQPNFSFINDGEENLQMRYSGFLNASIGIGSTTASIDPGLYIQFQGPAMEVMIGADYKVLVNEGSKFTGNLKQSSVAIGLFHRYQDALIARALFNYGNLGTGLSYDFNVSRLSNASKGRGGTEVFLRWIMEDRFTKSKARI